MTARHTAALREELQDRRTLARIARSLGHRTSRAFHLTLALSARKALRRS